MHPRFKRAALPVRGTLSFLMALTLMVMPLLPFTGPQIAFAANDIVLTQTGGSTTVNESGSTDQILVRLSDQPTANVVISVTSSDIGEVTVSPTQLTFTPANYNVEQPVTVTGVDDSDVDGNVLSTIVFQVVTSGPDYAGKSTSMQVTTVDNEEQATAGFTITEPDGQTRVNESGTSDTFTVALNKRPTGQVVLNVTSGDTTEVTASPGQLTFNPGNWNTGQTVTVTGVDDTIPDGPQTSSIIVSVNPAATTDDTYDTVASQTVSVATQDNEAPAAGFFVEESGGSTTVSEDGTTDTFTVRLTQQPQGSVVINVTSADTGEVTVSPDRLTFTTANWNIPQTVTVTGVNDAVADGLQTVSVVLSVNDTLSADEFDNVPDQTVQVTNQDNEPPAAGISVSKTSVTVSESGSSETFRVWLSKQPASPVVVSLTSSDTGEVTVSPSQLTFDQNTWDDPQTVTVTGVDDAEDDGNQTSTITLSVVDALSDDEYDAVADRTVTVTTTDNDPSVRIAPVPLSPCGAKLNTLGPALTWTQEPGARWFHLEVTPFNNDGPGINLIISDAAQVAAAQYQVREPAFGASDANYVMLPDLTYTWRVRTALGTSQPNEFDWSSWSANCSFETANRSSSSITLQSPAGGNTMGSLRPTLQWTNSDGTVFYYEVQMSRDPNFCNTAGCPMLYWELRHGGVANPPNSYTPPANAPLETGQTYFWRVRPRVQGDGSPVAWTPAASFRTN